MHYIIIVNGFQPPLQPSLSTNSSAAQVPSEGVWGMPPRKLRFWCSMSYCGFCWHDCKLNNPVFFMNLEIASNLLIREGDNGKQWKLFFLSVSFVIQLCLLIFGQRQSYKRDQTKDRQQYFVKCHHLHFSKVRGKLMLDVGGKATFVN